MEETRRSSSTGGSTRPSGSAPCRRPTSSSRIPRNGAPATERTEVRIVYNRNALYMGVDLLRRRAGPAAAVPAPARRVPAGRRSVHVGHRSVPHRAERLLLRNQPVRADGRRAAEPHGPEPAVGRHLDAARRSDGHRLDPRSRDSVQHAELRSERHGVGHQLPAHRAPQERREPVDRLGAQSGAPAAVEHGPLEGPEQDISQGLGLDVRPFGLASADASPGQGSRTRTSRPRPASTSSTASRPACAPTSP